MRKTPSSRLKALAAAAALAIAAAAPAQALVVFDPNNYAQNLLTAARTLQQINNQITSLQNEAQLLLNGAKNLTSLNFTALAELKTNLARTRALIDQAKGLAFEVSKLEAKFTSLYPQGYPAGATAAALATGAQDRWSASLESLRTAMQVQAEVSGQVAADEATLSEISSRSSAAVGVLQATQATNELLALTTKQAMQGQQLALAEGRAAASEAARALAAEARAKAMRAQFAGAPAAYAPLPVKAFGQ